MRITADSAVGTSSRLRDLFASDRARIEWEGRRAGSSLRVHDALKSRPILSLPEACNRAKLSFTAVSTAMNTLAGLGIAREITGKCHSRLFAYERYTSILNEGTER